MLFSPYYSPGMGLGMGAGYVPQTVTYDTVPLDEVEVRRGEHVHATDGHIGKVQGLVIDPDSRHVTHVLLQEGHLWGRKEVAIPIGAVTGVDDGIRLNITKQQVRTCRRRTSITQLGRAPVSPESAVQAAARVAAGRTLSL